MESFCTVVYAPSELERAMTMLVQVFRSHVERHDGDKLHLNRREMGNLFREELREILKEANRDPQRVGEIMLSLDQDLDGKVNFEEFVSMATKLFMCTSTYFDICGGGLMCGYE